jgi:hypothetical protein
MAKAAIAVASAALESNLTHLSSIGMGFAEVRPKLYTTPQIIKRRIFERGGLSGKIVLVP